MSDVFSAIYFDVGLRLHPTYGIMGVFIPDITFSWVMNYIKAPYRSTYVLQVLNSLLYLRFSTPEMRQRNISDNEENVVLERVSDLNISTEALASIPPTTAQDPRRLLVMQQLNVQCLFLSDDTNIDEDMWRLYALWKKMREDESDTMDLYTLPKCSVRKPFPQDRPKLQLILKDADRYLEAKSSVDVFYQWYEVPEGNPSPPSPILASPTPALSSWQHEPDGDGMEIDETCLQWELKARQEKEDRDRTLRQQALEQHCDSAVAPVLASTTTSALGSGTGRSSIKLPDMQGLSIQE
ncbi:hypothetical protein BGZ99_006463 [Dissophora globulifera]|uniref:Uncharacterized protein n=1 Tax=Dissophora globulifera TaxID=979702 RepID=A0A9P6USD5_9FUNG|nr:hypothetical protein BGZ99_006463 [Dissophora globulifera]